jgi:acyl carrier protein
LVGPVSGLVRALSELSEEERREKVLQVVREDIARVLALPVESVGKDGRLRDTGMDSLMAVELRNALGKRVGQELPATLAFDYPTAEAIAEYLLNEVLSLGESEDIAAEHAIRAALAEVPLETLRHRGLLEPLLQLIGEASPDVSEEEQDDDSQLSDLSDEALLDIVSES